MELRCVSQRRYGSCALSELKWNVLFVSSTLIFGCMIWGISIGFHWWDGGIRHRCNSHVLFGLKCTLCLLHSDLGVSGAPRAKRASSFRNTVAPKQRSNPDLLKQRSHFLLAAPNIGCCPRLSWGPRAWASVNHQQRRHGNSRLVSFLEALSWLTNIVFRKPLKHLRN